MITDYDDNPEPVLDPTYGELIIRYDGCVDQSSLLTYSYQVWKMGKQSWWHILRWCVRFRLSLLHRWRIGSWWRGVRWNQQWKIGKNLHLYFNVQRFYLSLVFNNSLTFGFKFSMCCLSNNSFSILFRSFFLSVVQVAHSLSFTRESSNVLIFLILWLKVTIIRIQPKCWLLFSIAATIEATAKIKKKSMTSLEANILSFWATSSVSTRLSLDLILSYKKVS